MSSCCWPTRTARRGIARRSRRAARCSLALTIPGPYGLQAAIASLQLEPAIDWPQVVALYTELERVTGSPVVALNRAVAVAEAGDVEAALALVDALGSTATATCIRRAPSCCGGSAATEARAEYERALELGPTEPERRFLERRIRGG